LDKISTSAFQTEGATKTDGRKPSIWDTFCLNKNNIIDGTNADVACDFYNNFEPDIKLVASLVLKMFRFSISWSRVLPNGIGEVNPLGIAFYKNVCKCCLEHGIEPVVTLFHWDLPQILQDQGGYASDKFVSRFLYYSDVVISELKPFTKKFITINQPYSIFNSVISGNRAPASKDKTLAFIAAYNCLLALGSVVDLCRKKHSNIEIGIVINLIYFEPFSNSKEDIKSTETQDVITNEFFYQTILCGKFPKKILDIANELGLYYMYSNENNLKIISSKLDFLGINYYQRSFTKSDKNTPLGYKNVYPLNNNNYTDGQREIYPNGLALLLNRIKAITNDLPLYITENGADYRDCGLNDEKRILYISNHLKVISSLIAQGIKIKGYLLWTLIDNFELENGYVSKYGIYHINKNMERVPKKSAI